MTQNAAIKLGLEALRSSLDDELNKEAVEITVIDASGVHELEREKIVQQIERLKPLDEGA